MPAPKTKAPAAPNAAKVNKSSSPANSGTSTPVSTTEKKDVDSEAITKLVGGKPDKKIYDAEQEKLKKEIDALQTRLSSVKEKISLATKSGGPGSDRRTALRAELESIRGQQSTNKSSRGKILDQIKTIQDGVQKKIKDLQAAKGKIPFKNVAEVDAHIKNLEKQVESGSLKLADEKRALADISTSKRTRRIVETFQTDQDSIEADRATVEGLRKQLDDPEFKATSDRFDAIKAELDELKKEGDEAYANRSKLFEERDSIQAQLNTFFNQKRELTSQYREANDIYWNKVNEDRARRAEKARAQRAAEEAQKKADIAERLLEEAKVPAFQAQIEDCQTLIDLLSGKVSGNASSAPLLEKNEIAGIAKLEVRQVEAVPEGSIVRKKKGEDEDAYFVGKGKSKGKKGTAKASEIPASPSTPTSATLNLPFATLSALLSLSIPPPASSADVPRVVDDLKTKKAWFEANQTRVTAENIAKAESDIQRLTASKDAKASETTSGVETPAEPLPTPKDDAELTIKPSTTETLDNAEEVLEKELVGTDDSS
ncbi:hypothetical protein H0H93_002383 [Arthromyces matolae]|nr:hypothetical protein H0H93_002383 [Arthromyces matolae]